MKRRGWIRTGLAGAACAGLALTFTVTAGAAGATPAAPAPAARSVNWPYYGNNLGSTRYQNVDQVSTGNVGKLRPAWIFHTGVLSTAASFEASPIVINGVMYVSTGLDDVYALNATTGSELWGYHPEKSMPKLSKLSICCAEDNRGVAYAGGMIFIARMDGVLVALNAHTGKPVWQTRVADWRHGYTMTIAPQVAGDRVVVGVSGGEYEIRGFVAAYSQRTGALDWRFYTTQPGTWAGKSWRKGGAPVWGNPAVDPSLGLVYFTTGNAAPDMNGKLRAGKNLYSASIVAVSLATGRLRWYFQEVHHDIWDYDGPQPPMLFDVRAHGRTVPALGHCNKSGEYYILNRRTGKPVFPVTERSVPAGPKWQHAWPTQPISSVQPLTPQSVSYTPPGLASAAEFTPPTKHPQLMQPGADGGCEWEPAAYSPRTRDVYYETRYLPAVNTANPAHPNGSTGGEILGSNSSEPVPGVRYYGIVGAVSTTTGHVAWRHALPMLVKSGMLVAGNLVFYGDNNGTFTAADARSGAPRWNFQATRYGTVGAPAAGPVAYAAGGHEYVASPFGGNSLDAAFQGSVNGDAVVAFALPGPHYGGPHITYSDTAFASAGANMPATTAGPNPAFSGG